ncbi:MAG: hydrolase [Candidatus Saccharibacteria bacterium]|nr:hydrolase [Candidatus Saccharibacteria bacterium]
MISQTINGNIVGAIRVSTVKQGVDGDSPDDQQKLIAQYAATRNLKVARYFVFLESASKELQPMQEVIDYCKDPKNNVKQVIIKSIDRFTRGGADFYNPLKNQLEECGVSLVDVYGIIGNIKVNTLEHLGVKYKWSEFSPTKKAEMLEAERAKDEVRDIQTRMIGAQIRYARLGYWVRRPLYGFDNVHVETHDGKRCILKPNKVEAPLVEKMFELRARGTMEDIEIVEEINRLGFRTRERVIRDKEDRTKVIEVLGSEPLILKQLWRMIENPVYAGVNPEKWTQGNPVKCKFDGLVSFELFNAANKGKIIITEDNEGVHIHHRKPAEHLLKKGVKNSEFPFKRIVMCPGCKLPLYGSSSRGRHGKHFPAYHCNQRGGHYFRKSKKEFDNTIEEFVKHLDISEEYISELMEYVGKAFDKQQLETHRDSVTLDLHLTQLRNQIRVNIDKIKLVNSETTIKYLEEDIMKLEAEIAEVTSERQTKEEQKPVDMEKMKAYVHYFLAHLEELLLHHSNPVLQAKYFGVIFNDAPTYDDIVSGTPDCSKITGVNTVFVPKKLNNVHMAGMEGLEPPNARSLNYNQDPWLSVLTGYITDAKRSEVPSLIDKVVDVCDDVLL